MLYEVITYHLGIELDYGWNLAYYLITLLTVKLFWYVGLKAFYAVLELLGVKEYDGFRITSYNVCYTKLLRIIIAPIMPIMVMVSGVAQGGAILQKY